MTNSTFFRNNREQGFVLVAAMVFLLALTLLGILAVNNSSFERLLGGNERLQVDSFYDADSGIAAAIGLLLANNAVKGFSTNEALAMRGIGFDSGYNNNNPPTFYMEEAAPLKALRGPTVPDLNGDGNNDTLDEGLFFGQHALGQDPVGLNPTNIRYRDAFYPRTSQLGGTPGQIPTTSLKITALDAAPAAGFGIASNEGYHKPTSGVQKTYNIRSRHDNINGAASQVHIQWRQMIKN